MALNTPPTAAEIQNAGTDLDTLDKVINGAADINGDGTIDTRRGGPVRSLAWYLAQIEASRLGAAAVTAGLEAQQDDVDDIVASLAPAGPLALILAQMNDLTAASGIYPVSLGAHDALESVVIDDPRDTVTREELRAGELVTVRYRPRVLPFTIEAVFDPADFYEMSSATGASGLVLAELRRLASYHPPVAPAFNPIDALMVAADTSGTLLDLNTYVTDTDSPPENRTFTLLDALPAGFTLVGSEVRYATPPIVAATSVGVRVTDESGQSAVGTLSVRSYDPAYPPSTPPSWLAIPARSVAQSSAIASINMRSYLVAGSSPLNEIAISATGLPTGLVSNDGIVTGTLTAAGTFNVVWTATDTFGNVVTATQAWTVALAPAPAWSSIPQQTIWLGQSIPPVRYLNYVADPNTPDASLAISVTSAPAGTSLVSKELRGTPSAVGGYTVTVTATNLAGVSSSITHLIYVLAAPASGGTSGGSGGSTGRDVQLF